MPKAPKRKKGSERRYKLGVAPNVYTHNIKAINRKAESRLLIVSMMNCLWLWFSQENGNLMDSYLFLVIPFMALCYISLSIDLPFIYYEFL